MTRRITRSADFARALAAPSRQRTAHFALHHAPSTVASASGGELSTGEGPDGTTAVDEAVSFGLAIPKRHARRAVTRSLLKRLARAAAERRRDRLASGIWVVRLRVGFDRKLYPSAASDALKRVARDELEALFALPEPPVAGDRRSGR